MKMKNPEEFVQAMNLLTNSENPHDRLAMASELATGLGRLLVCPPEILEQLTVRLEADLELVRSEGRATQEAPLDDTAKKVFDAVHKLSENYLIKISGTLRAFLATREQFQAALMEATGWDSLDE